MGGKDVVQSRWRKRGHLAAMLHAVVIAPLLAAGCASMNDTVAQGLAETRWRECDHFATVRLDRIALDGHVFASADLPDLAEFRGCIEGKAAEQIRDGALKMDPGVTVDPVPGME